MIAEDFRVHYRRKRRGMNPPLAFVTTLLMPGLHAILVYRFGHWVSRRGVVLKVLLLPLYTVLSLAVQATWGIEIGRQAKLGKGVKIIHQNGIVIADFAEIGDNCLIMQGVTIGHSGRGRNNGVPVIGNQVRICSGAKVIGKIRIGNNVTIGANAVVHKDLPDGVTAVAYPGFKIIDSDSEYRDAEGE